jgi:spoIIIJ-associated protein
MSAGSDFIEATGETVEDAIEHGLNELGVSPAQVMIEVLEEPGGGLFGSEKRLARVRLQLLGGRGLNAPAMPFVPSPEPAQEVLEVPRYESEPRERFVATPSRDEGRTQRPERTPRPSHKERRERGDRNEPRPDRLAQPTVERSERNSRPYFDDVDDKDENLPLIAAHDEVPESEQDEEAQVSKVVLNELLERMSLRAQIVVRRAKAGDETDRSPWVLDVIAGRMASRLVGRRGETLAALQYITRLIASRELQRRVDVVVDIESYKVKRAENLHGLALRMAEEAISQQRVIMLEPMPPHERRIIHIALRGREDVVTKSTGEGQSRKVTIVPQSLNI